MNLYSEIVTVPDIAAFAARRFGDRPALSAMPPGTAKNFSFNELQTRMQQGAGRLAGGAFRRGAPVLLLAAPGPERLMTLLAILAAGLVAVPLPPDTVPDRVDALARELDAALVVAEPSDLSVQVVRHCPTWSPDELFSTPANRGAVMPPRPEEPALLIATSGTTGPARFVTLSHASLVSNIQGILRACRPEPHEILLSILPPYHLFELVVGQFCPLLAGAQLCFAGTCLPNRLLGYITDAGITRILMVPALLEVLGQILLQRLRLSGLLDDASAPESPAAFAHWLQSLDSGRRRHVRAQLGSFLPHTLRHIVIGGAALDAVWPPVLGALGIELEIGYGLTEAGPVVALGVASECPPGSVGRPLPGVETSISDQGELRVRGPSIMSGYYRTPAETAAALTGGWLHTGDQGHIDDDGFLFIHGRLKEAIVTATGLTLFPEEIEPWYQAPQFREACIVPASDGAVNETAVLVVVPASSRLRDDELLELVHCLRAAAPERYRVSSMRLHSGPLPRNGSGKICRRALARSLNLAGGSNEPTAYRTATAQSVERVSGYRR